MNRSTEPQTPSETTGPRRLGETLPSVIGQPHGETGYAVTPELVEAATARLVSQRPQVTQDNLLATLRLQHGISLELESRYMFPPNGKPYKKPTSFQALRTENSDIDGARRAIELAMLPASRAMITKHIAALKAKTKSRAQGEVDMGMEIAVYEAELSKYPADIAIESMREAGETSMWFPSWFELKEIIDRHYEPRRQIAHIVQSMT